MATETSIWKKEIRLRRRPSAEEGHPLEPSSPGSRWETPKREELWVAPAGGESASVVPVDEISHSPEPPTNEKTSIWKKEISLRRSAAPESAVESAPEISAPVPSSEESQPEPAPVEKTSVWKKEITLRRSATPAAVTGSEAEDTTPAVSLVEPWSEPATEKSSVWKKEISLSRRQKPPKAVDTERVSEARGTQKTPIWKKEINLRREPKPKPQRPTSPVEAPEEQPGRESLLKRDIQIHFRRRPKVAADVATLVGLRIGSSQLAAALVNNNGSAELVKLARAPLARGIVTAGEVRDADALARALKRFFAENKLPRRGVRLGIATNRIGVRVIEVPENDDPKLFANAIRFRAQDVVPIPLADAVLDHVVLGETDDGKQQRVLVVFAHRELVDGYLDACKRAGLKLAGIDFDAFALLRALSDGSQPSGAAPSALVAVAIGHERTIFAVSEGSICDFARVLEWGGSAFDKTLARALDISPEEAEGVKQNLSLAGEGTGGLSGVELEAARTALRQELQVLARELLSSLQFYQSRPDSLDIGEVLLTGGAAQLAGIGEELERQLGVPVRMGDPLGRVTVASEAERPAASGSLAIAVGLGIED